MPNKINLDELYAYEKEKGEYAYDGDTLYNNEGKGARLQGINTPESGVAGDRDAQLLAQDFAGSEVISDGETGYYGRSLEDRRNTAGTRLTHELLRQGLANTTTSSSDQQQGINDTRVIRELMGTMSSQEQFYSERRAKHKAQRDADLMQSLLQPNTEQVRIKRSTGLHSDALARGTDQVQQMTYGLAKLFGDSFDSETLSKWAKDGIDLQTAEVYFNPRHNRSLGDASGFSETAGSLYESFMEQMPNIGATLATSLASGGVAAFVSSAGKMAATEALAATAAKTALVSGVEGAAAKQAVSAFTRGQQIGASAASFGMNTGETKIGFDAEGIDDNGKVFLVGAAKSALDIFSLGQIPGVNRLIGMGARASKIPNKTAKEMFHKIPLDVAKAMVTEGSAESMQTAFDKLAINSSLGREWSEHDTAEMIEAGVIGAVTGGGISIPGAIAQNLPQGNLAVDDIDNGAPPASPPASPPAGTPPDPEYIAPDDSLPEAGSADSVPIDEADYVEPEPIAEEPIAEEPIAEEPIAEEPIAEEPIAEEPIAEEPIAEEPIAEEPIAEEPIAEEPAATFDKDVEGGTTPDSPETIAAQTNSLGKGQKRGVWESKSPERLDLAEGSSTEVHKSEKTAKDVNGKDKPLYEVRVVIPNGQSGVLTFLHQSQADKYAKSVDEAVAKHAKEGRLIKARVKNTTVEKYTDYTQDVGDTDSASNQKRLDDTIDVLNASTLYGPKAKGKSQIKGEPSIVRVMSKTDKDEAGNPVVIESVIVDSENKLAIERQLRNRYNAEDFSVSVSSKDTMPQEIQNREDANNGVVRDRLSVEEKQADAEIAGEDTTRIDKIVSAKAGAKDTLKYSTKKAIELDRAKGDQEVSALREEYKAASDDKHKARIASRVKAIQNQHEQLSLDAASTGKVNEDLLYTPPKTKLGMSEKNKEARRKSEAKNSNIEEKTGQDKVKGSPTRIAAFGRMFGKFFDGDDKQEFSKTRAEFLDALGQELQDDATAEAKRFAAIKNPGLSQRVEHKKIMGHNTKLREELQSERGQSVVPVPSLADTVTPNTLAEMREQAVSYISGLESNPPPAGRLHLPERKEHAEKLKAAKQHLKDIDNEPTRDRKTDRFIPKSLRVAHVNMHSDKGEPILSKALRTYAEGKYKTQSADRAEVVSLDVMNSGEGKSINLEQEHVDTDEALGVPDTKESVDPLPTGKLGKRQTKEAAEDKEIEANKRASNTIRTSKKVVALAKADPTFRKRLNIFLADKPTLPQIDRFLSKEQKELDVASETKSKQAAEEVLDTNTRRIGKLLETELGKLNKLLAKIPGVDTGAITHLITGNTSRRKTKAKLIKLGMHKVKLPKNRDAVAAAVRLVISIVGYKKALHIQGANRTDASLDSLDSDISLSDSITSELSSSSVTDLTKVSNEHLSVMGQTSSQSDTLQASASEIVAEINNRLSAAGTDHGMPFQVPAPKFRILGAKNAQGHSVREFVGFYDPAFDIIYKSSPIEFQMQVEAYVKTTSELYGALALYHRGVALAKTDSSDTKTSKTDKALGDEILDSNSQVGEQDQQLADMGDIFDTFLEDAGTVEESGVTSLAPVTKTTTPTDNTDRTVATSGKAANTFDTKKNDADREKLRIDKEARAKAAQDKRNLEAQERLSSDEKAAYAEEASRRQDAFRRLLKNKDNAKMPGMASLGKLKDFLRSKAIITKAELMEFINSELPLFAAMFSGLPDSFTIVRDDSRSGGSFNISTGTATVNTKNADVAITAMHEMLHAVGHVPARLADMMFQKGVAEVTKMAKAMQIDQATIDAAVDILNAFKSVDGNMPASVGDTSTPSEMMAVAMSDPLAASVANSTKVNAAAKSKLSSFLKSILETISNLIGLKKGNALHLFYRAAYAASQSNSANTQTQTAGISSVEQSVMGPRGARNKMNRLVGIRNNLSLTKIVSSIRNAMTITNAKAVGAKAKEVLTTIATPFLTSYRRLYNNSKSLAEATARWHHKFQTEKSLHSNKFHADVVSKFTTEQMERGFAELHNNDATSPAGKAIKAYLQYFTDTMSHGASAYLKAKLRDLRGKFPFVPNVDVIEADPAAFADFITQGDYYVIQDGVRTKLSGNPELVATIVDNIVGHSAASSEFGTVPGHGMLNSLMADPNFTKDAYNSNFMYTDPVSAISMYIDTISKFKNFENEFGAWNNLGSMTPRLFLDLKGFDTETMSKGHQDKLIARFVSSGEVKFEGGKVSIWSSDHKQETMFSQISEEGGNTQDARKTVSGIVGTLGRDLDPRLKHTFQWATVSQAYALLAFSTITSLPELGINTGLMAAKSPSAAFKGLITFVRNVGTQASTINAGGKLKLQNNKSIELARMLGVITDSIASVAYSDASNFDVNGTGPKIAMEFLFKYNLNSMFTNMNRAISMEMGIAYFTDLAAKGDDAALKRWGVTTKQINAWNTNKTGVFKHGTNVSNANTINHVNASLLKFVDQHVARPTSLQKAVIGNDQRFMLITQLKSFFYSYAASIIPEIARTSADKYNAAVEKGDYRAVASIKASLPLIITGLMAAPLAILAREIKAGIRDTDEDQDRIRAQQGSLEQVFDVIRGTGLLGPADLLMGIYEAEDYGQSPISRALGPTVGALDVMLKHGIYSPEFTKRMTPILGTVQPRFWDDWRRDKRQADRDAKKNRLREERNRRPIG